MKTTQKAILRTLLYFDIFNHPLHRSELFELLSVNTTREMFDQELNELTGMKLLGSGLDYFYLLMNRLK